MNLNEKINELFDLLDDSYDIKKLEILKGKIGEDELLLIQEYQKSPTIDKKKKIFENNILKEYYGCENNLNYLIMEINKKFQRSHICQK